MLTASAGAVNSKQAEFYKAQLSKATIKVSNILKIAGRCDMMYKTRIGDERMRSFSC
jgi:hypothetical protein